MRISIWGCVLALAVVCEAMSTAGLQRLQRAGSGNSIKLTKRNLEQVVAGPRDDWLVVLLTATNAQVGCSVCVSLAPEFEMLVDSWAQDHPDGDGLFFAKADFADGDVEVFQKFELQTVPKMFIYKPTASKTRGIEGWEPLAVPQADFALQLAQIIGERTGKSIVIHVPFPWGNVITTAIVTFSVVLAIKKHFDKVLLVLTSKPVWGVAIVVSVLFFNTGYMYNAIRNTPYVRMSQQGTTEYFAPGQQSQFGVETQIMAIIYGTLAFCVVSLATIAPKIHSPRLNCATVLALSVFILLVFSVLVSIFKFKSAGYPYHLLNIWKP